VAEPQHPASGGSALRVTVVVPHYNDLPALGRCLDALQTQTLSADAFEIVVADNASPQGEAAVAAVIAGRARLLTVPERGAGPARNAGVGAAQAPIIAFTDSDCVPEPGWLNAGLSALERYDIVGGQMEVLVDPSRPKTGAEAFEQVFAFRNERYIRDKGFSVSANLFCSRKVFTIVGGFGVGLSEDVDWCHRATSLGYMIGFAEAAVVGHPARVDWPELLIKWRRINYEGYHLALKEGRRLRWMLSTYLLPASVLAHLPRVMASRSLGGRRERMSAIMTLTRLRAWRLIDAHRLFFGLRR
jgi:GT2 family glycosyltransferase